MHRLLLREDFHLTYGRNAVSQHSIGGLAVFAKVLDSIRYPGRIGCTCDEAHGAEAWEALRLF